MSQATDGRNRSPMAPSDALIDVAGVEGMEDRLIRALKSRGRLLLIAGRFDVKYTFNLGQAHEDHHQAEHGL